MRRKLRLIGVPARPFDKLRIARGWGLLPLLLIAAFGAYGVYWWVAAGRIEREFAAWAQHARAENYDISWRDLRVTGFPVAFRLELTQVSLHDGAISPAPLLTLPALSGSARPWDPKNWHLAARRGLTLAIAPLTLVARSATGAVSVGPAGGATLWLTLANAAAPSGTGGSRDAEGGRIAIGLADSWIVLPPRPPGAQVAPPLHIAVHVQQIRLPVGIAPLGDTIEDLSAGLTVTGALPPGPLPRAVSAWRDSGGTVALDHLRLRWGALGATGAGTVALDRDLQPVGGFSGAVEGYGEILTALVKSGRIRPREAGLARLLLAMAAKAGPDGRPEIATSFTIEHGEMYLGPAKLGPAPRIVWE
ncbi:MAG TPA: DUF2125 domain-containing protein [Stellaceae bacterium]|nr:DUF2125 domain-containing protein [Stellaceae bacterium]